MQKSRKNGKLKKKNGGERGTDAGGKLKNEIWRKESESKEFAVIYV